MKRKGEEAHHDEPAGMLRRRGASEEAAVLLRSGPVVPPACAASTRRGISNVTVESLVRIVAEDSVSATLLVAEPVLTAAECDAWITFADATNGLALEKHAQSRVAAHRDNFRLAIASEPVARAIFDRLGPLAPPAIIGVHGGTPKRLAGCNPNLRLYKYEAGQRFGPHVDESNRLADGSTTEFTVLLYLNDDGLQGGDTVFYADHDAKREAFRFAPRRGAALLHAHGARCLTHEGAPVLKGAKYILRTDLDYR